MIIEYDFANDLLEEIEIELNEYEENKGINVRDISVSKTADLDWMYKTQEFSLPVFKISSTDIVQITKEYYQILVNNWQKEHPKLVQKGIDETIESKMKTDFPEQTIYSAISDKISNLIYQYDSVLKITKESNRLYGIEDEKKILIIHLNKYIEVINSNTDQIDIFHGITLSKKINNLVLEIYIRFINARLKMLDPELPDLQSKPIDSRFKVVWKGSQKDLCELFVELEEKDWIEKIKWGERSKIASSICNLFDLTLTKKSENSNPENSFYQILKGIHNRKTKQRDYEEILGNLNDRKFNKIKKNGY